MRQQAITSDSLYEFFYRRSLVQWLNTMKPLYFRPHGYGWNTGGCYLAARALALHLGGKLLAVVSEEEDWGARPQHVLVPIETSQGYRWLDARGVHDPLAFVHYWNSTHRSDSMCNYVLTSAELPGLMFDEAMCAQLVSEMSTWFSQEVVAEEDHAMQRHPNDFSYLGIR